MSVSLAKATPVNLRKRSVTGLDLGRIAASAQRHASADVLGDDFWVAMNETSWALRHSTEQDPGYQHVRYVLDGLRANLAAQVRPMIESRRSRLSHA